MTILNSRNKIMPNDYEYHLIRKIKIECGCGKTHIFERIKDKKTNNKKKVIYDCVKCDGQLTETVLGKCLKCNICGKEYVVYKAGGQNFIL